LSRTTCREGPGPRRRRRGGGCRSGVGVSVDRRGLGRPQPQLAERRLEGLGPLAVGEDLLEAVVEERPERLVALGQADAVGLLAERRLDQLERVAPLRGAGLDQAGQDGVVGRDGRHATVAQRLGALAVEVEQRHVGLRRLGPDVLLRGRAPDGAHVLAVEVLDTVDGGVGRLHHDVLPGDEVRPGEPDPLLAGVVDGVGRDHQVDLAVLKERLAIGRDGLHELHLLARLVGRAAEDGGRHQLADFDVEALHLAGGRVPQPEAGQVELDADGHRARRLQPGHRRPRSVLGRAVLAVARRVGRDGGVVVAAAGSQPQQGQARHHHGRQSSRSAHRVSLLVN
jgi:hypothetical protein